LLKVYKKQQWLPFSIIGSKRWISFPCVFLVIGSSLPKCTQQYLVLESTLFFRRRVKGQKCPWLTVELKRKMNNRDKVLRKARKSNSTADWNLYKNLRNACNNQLRKEKTTYHQRLLRESSPNTFWSIIKNIFPVKPIIKTVRKDIASRVKIFLVIIFSTAVRILKPINLPLESFSYNLRLYPQVF